MDSHMTRHDQLAGQRSTERYERRARAPAKLAGARSEDEECGARGPVLLLAHARARAHRHTAQTDRRSPLRLCALAGCADTGFCRDRLLERLSRARRSHVATRCVGCGKGEDHGTCYRSEK